GLADGGRDVGDARTFSARQQQQQVQGGKQRQYGQESAVVDGLDQPDVGVADGKIVRREIEHQQQQAEWRAPEADEEQRDGDQQQRIVEKNEGVDLQPENAKRPVEKIG